jgi:predicted nicotinamide N-methyase
MTIALDDPAALTAFVRASTRLQAPPLAPEFRLWLADEITPIWSMTEAALERTGLPPPFWAFAWAGGQALARHVLDHPDLVAGRRVMSFACGAGLEALAAAKAGASEVWANDVDPVAVAAATANAVENGLALTPLHRDLLARPDAARAFAFEAILAGDVCYEGPMAARVTAFLTEEARRGALVLIGDGGRGFPPQGNLVALARHEVPTPRELEDRDSRVATVWRLAPD